MKTSVNAGSATTCPTCARPLPAGAPAGLCPACLLAQGTETESGAGGPRTRFEPPPLAEIAALFPQLEILRLLGAGGMGAVYQARQPALDRFVALKVLPADADGGANFTERFNREARALARLNHPNIVTVHEFGQAGGLNYFLMEFVDGANLRQLEQAGRLSPREALQIIPQICDALQYAHDEGVVHRDIKPENVLVDRKGRVKIADFGLAKILGHDPEAARLTVEGQVMGTPHYMAPEQVERPLTVDHRADIYALGVVFYEMLTGDLPLGKFAPPSRKVQVDVRLDEIVLRALENDPARRYQQASEVKQRVATVVESPAAASSESSAEPEEAGPKPGARYLRWLGIPAVVERDGEREVNFQGALGVFFVMLMTSALVQPMVRWATGTEYATPQLGFVTASMMAIWAIRRTMNRPWDEAPRRAANGTVILPPSPRRDYWLDGLMVVGLVAFVVGIHLFKTQVINPRLSSERSGPPSRQTGELNRETAFGQPMLLTFDELVDFDTGHAADFPPAEPGSNPLAGIGENILWAQDNGFDAVAGAGKLDLLGVTVAEINEAVWETMTPTQAESRLAATGTKPRELTPKNPDHGTPPAYAFRTREGGLGLIRFVEFRNTRTGFTVQLKQVTPASGAVGVIRAQRDGKTGELVGRLPGRGVVTLSALRPGGAGATEWWRPDGRPVDGIAPQFAEDFARSFPTSNVPGRLWQLLLRAEHLPSPEDDLHFEFPGVLNRFFTGGAVVPSGGANPGVVFLHALWPDSATNATVRVGVPMAQWHTIRSYEPLSRSFTKTSLGDDPRWNLELHAAGVGTKGAQITVVIGTNYPGWNLRVLATRLGQDPAVGAADASVTNGPSVTRTFVFPELKTLDAVQNFQVQAQPVQWVEFADLALNHPSPVSPPTSPHFGALERRVFSDLLDFDTGGMAVYKAGATHQASQGGNLFEGLADTVSWMRRNGFDAQAGSDQLHVVDLEVVPLENGDWDTLTAAELADRLNQRVNRPQFLKPTPGGQLPATFGFRTRERGIGILQLVAFGPRESKATVSYKLVLGAGVRPLAAPSAAALELRPVVPAGDAATPFELLTTVEGRPMRVAKIPWLQGDAFADASWRMDPVSNARVIVLRLSDSGRREFARLSAEHVREQVALVLGGRVLVAPQIAAPMDVATLELGGLDRERGQFQELLAALNPRPAAAGPIRFGEEHEAVVLMGGREKFHWYNLAEARAMTVAGTDRSTREYHEARRGMGGDLEALGENPMPVVSGHDLTVVPLGDGQPPTALEVAYRWELLHQESEPENLLSTGTYALRTRRGFTGILEVIGWAQDQSGVRIRYREVLNSNAAP